MKLQVKVLISTKLRNTARRTNPQDMDSMQFKWQPTDINAACMFKGNLQIKMQYA